MKKSILIILICIFFLSGCSSKPVMLPGEKKVTIQNIYSEYYSIAEEYYKLKNYSKAIEYYSLAKEHKAFKNLALYKLASCYMYTSKWAECIDIYKKLLNADKSNYSLKENLAYVYAMKGEKEKALSLYKELHNLYPENENYVENLIILYLAGEKNKEADTEIVSELIKTLETISPENKNLQKYKDAINLENSEEAAD